MDFKFKPEDRVRLTPQAVSFYGGAWPHFIPYGQGGGSAGTIIEAGSRPYKIGAAPRPYMVRWDNGVVNSYREDDLKLDDSDPEAHEIPEVKSVRSDSNIIRFKITKSK